MRKYLMRRFLNMIPTLILVSLIVFSLLRLLPSDPVRILAGIDESGAIDPGLYARIKPELGLDRPIDRAVCQLDGGCTEWQLGEILPDRHAGVSANRRSLAIHRATGHRRLALRGHSGYFAGDHLGHQAQFAADIAVTTFAISGVAIPHFWLGMMLIILFAVWLGWLPFGGFNASLFTSPGYGSSTCSCPPSSWAPGWRPS